jgi:hypothetical protein
MSYGVDNNWYIDTCAMDHITSELDKLTMRDRYHGSEQVHTASRSGMEINHIGHNTSHSSTSKIHLKNILHVPQANKILIKNCS